MHNDILPGGKADDKCSSNFDQDALQQGIEVELEHTDDPEIAEEIATDHLDEDEDYYDKLAEMEAGALDEINDQEGDRYEDPIKYGATAWDASKHPRGQPENPGQFKPNTIHISPHEFLKLAVPFGHQGGQQKDVAKVNKLAALKKWDTNPMLSVKENEQTGGLQVGIHDGRHRAEAAISRGEKTIPVDLVRGQKFARENPSVTDDHLPSLIGKHGLHSELGDYKYTPPAQDAPFALKPTQNAPKPMEITPTGGKQQTLFQTAGEPGQMNLFSDVGVPDELLPKHLRQPAPPADPPKPKVQKQLFRKSWREQKDNGQNVEYTLYAEVVDE